MTVDLYQIQYYKEVLMSSDKLFNISNGYMSHCGVDWCDILIKKERGVN